MGTASSVNASSRCPTGGKPPSGLAAAVAAKGKQAQAHQAKADGFGYRRRCVRLESDFVDQQRRFPVGIRALESGEAQGMGARAKRNGPGNPVRCSRITCN